MTRARAIQATIDVLCDSGHAAATTVNVAKRARISRGALLHQFPTRTALLLAVAKHIIAEQSRYRREHIVEANTGMKRYHSAIEISWDVQKHPGSIAMLEIMMATRNDPVLRSAFAAIVQYGDQVRREAAKLAAGDLGVGDVDLVDDMLQLHMAALRGLALQLMLGREPAAVERIRKLFTLYERRFATSLAEQTGAAAEPSATALRDLQS